MLFTEKYLDIIAQYPYGVQKLREMILTLAMQGKLVLQDPSEESASELLKQLEYEKKQLIKSGKTKKAKVTIATNIEKFPYELPSSWEWVRLSSVGNIFNGNSINAAEKERRYKGCSGYPYIATKDVGYVTDSLDYDNGICIPKDETKFKIAHSGAILLCAEGGSAGKKSGLVTQDICFGNKLFALEPFEKIDSKFILFLYNSNDFRCRFNACMTGIIGGVSIAKFAEILIPLPPASEQKRIVKKIEELMAICDRLDEMIKEKKKILKKTQQALVKNLFSGIDFEENMLKLLANIRKFNGSKEDIDEIRKIILQLAVMGKLVPQDPSDEPVSELLRNIKSEKEKLAKTKAGTKRTTSSMLMQVDISYKIPASWVWVTLEDIIIYGPQNGYSPRAVAYKTDVKSLTLTATTSGVFLSEHFKYIDEKIPLNSDLWLRDGDILVQRGNTLEYVGVPCIFRGADNTFIYPDLMMKIRCSSYVNESYIHIAMNSFPARDFLRSRASGTSGTMPKISQKTLCNLPIPLPPKCEQNRIVLKINMLMRLCDHLERLIATHEAGCKIISDEAVKEICSQRIFA